MSPDEVERILLDALRSRGIALPWSERTFPRVALTAECELLGSDPQFITSLSSYLKDNPVIAQSLETVLAQLAFSAGIHWQQASDELRILARRGWHISRWFPTFLLIDGPLGRLLRHKDSPLSARLRSSAFPLLAGTRDLFNNDTFRRVRNGFAHWSFTWQDQGSSAIIKIIDWQTGKEDTQLTLLEAEALHFVSATSIHAIDQSLLRRATMT